MDYFGSLPITALVLVSVCSRTRMQLKLHWQPQEEESDVLTIAAPSISAIEACIITKISYGLTLAEKAEKSLNLWIFVEASPLQ